MYKAPGIDVKTNEMNTKKRKTIVLGVEVICGQNNMMKQEPHDFNKHLVKQRCCKTRHGDKGL